MSTLHCIFLTALVSASVASGQNNVMPISIGTFMGETNVGYVSVQVCEPGTTNCQTIPNIQLDTGSTGLRLIGSAVQLNLKAEQSSGEDVVECVQFGGGPGGSVLWGPVVLADLILGAEKAAKVPIHLANNSEGNAPSACGGTPITTPAAFIANGLLGISPASTDCDGETCPGTTAGKNYYTCKSGTCKKLSPAVALQVQNPVLMLPTDNNGIVVEFPAISAGGQSVTMEGQLILGIGTEANNKPVSGAKAYTTDPDGILHATVFGKEYYSKVDTGTSYWTLPAANGIPVCTGANSAFLCPTSPTQVSFNLVSNDGKTTGPTLDFVVGNGDSLMQSQDLAISDIVWNNAMPDTFLLPMPFFYGRSVYVGINGKTSSLGKGPYYGF